ncbi:hypothetical protein ACWGTI_25845 [Mesorhizobium sp. ArgA1]
MNDETELNLLYDHTRSLEKSIGDIERDIKTWVHRVGAQRVMGFLQDRYSKQREFIYELGAVEARIEAMEQLVPELESRHSVRQDDDRRTEGKSHLQWLERIQPVQFEPDQDHLDWFKEQLAQNPTTPEEPEVGEQPRQREPSPDDLLAWLPGRGRFL